MTMALKGGSPGQAAAVLQSLVLKALDGLCSEPAFDVCSCKYKEGKQWKISLIPVLYYQLQGLSCMSCTWSRVCSCLLVFRNRNPAGQAQALGPLQAVSSEVLRDACCRVRAFQLSPIPSTCAGQSLNIGEGRYPWINLLHQKAESQESHQPFSVKGMLMYSNELVQGLDCPVLSHVKIGAIHFQFCF